MKSCALLFLVYTISCADEKCLSDINQSGKNICPPWTSPPDCKCDRAIPRDVFCSSQGNKSEVNVMFGFCMTLDKHQKEVVVGQCPVTTRRRHYHTNYFEVPQCSSELDSAVCGATRRTGQLCGECEPGTSPPVYSYFLHCVNCTTDTNNWGRYLAVSLLPLTGFFLVAVILRLRVTSTHWNGVVFTFQILTSPILLRQFAMISSHLHYSNRILTNIYITIFSIWNLDFFRMIYPSFCLHSQASTLQILALDYITAAYPLVLIVLTYTLVTLHYRDCRLIVCLWRPFQTAFIHFQRKWSIQNSLVDAFATFLLLSYMKFVSTSGDLLTPTVLYHSEPAHATTVLYYDGSIEYFGHKHLPYALLAIVVVLVFILLPILLLCLYPCLCFQSILNRYHLRSQALNTFIDTFQGSFKDGTNGTRDYRYFAAIYLSARVVIQMVLVLAECNIEVIISVLVGMILLISIFQPYKKSKYNKVDSLFIGMTIIILVNSHLISSHQSYFVLYAARILLCLSLPLPLLYIACFCVSAFWKRSKVPIGWIKSSIAPCYNKLFIFCLHIFGYFTCKSFKGNYQMI